MLIHTWCMLFCRNAAQFYYEAFLNEERVQKIVASGAYSSSDFREIFKADIEKRVRSLPDIEVNYIPIIS